MACDLCANPDVVIDIAAQQQDDDAGVGTCPECGRDLLPEWERHTIRSHQVLDSDGNIPGMTVGVTPVAPVGATVLWSLKIRWLTDDRENERLIENVTGRVAIEVAATMSDAMRSQAHAVGIMGFDDRWYLVVVRAGFAEDVAGPNQRDRMAAAAAFRASHYEHAPYVGVLQSGDLLNL